MVSASSSLPSWLRPFLGSEGATSIAEAVRSEEISTSGELVPMVVRRSIAVGHVFPCLTLAMWLLYVSAGGPALFASWRVPSLWWCLLDLSVLAACAWALAKLPFVQRLLTSDADIERQVTQRAALEFAESVSNRTRHATGILLFISLTERRAVVLADRTIAGLLPQDTWNEVVSLMTAGARHADLAHGMVDAIRRCGSLIRTHFPASPRDRDELANALIIKE